MQDSAWQLEVEPLTVREQEILRHLADGASDREIAEQLFLSLNTIKWHNRQIYSKLGVGSRTQAVALASCQRDHIPGFDRRPFLLTDLGARRPCLFCHW